jgi:hypothetical protein
VTKPKALIVTYGGGHAALMAPVARSLADRGAVELVVLGLTTAATKYRAQGIEPRGYRDYVDPVRDAAALRLGEELAGDVQGESVGVSRAESVAYLGLSMADTIARLGEAQARRDYRERGRHAFYQRGVLARIIEAEGPQVVVATNSPKSERAAIEEGNLRRIETLQVPDLFAIAEWEAYAPFRARWFGAMSETTKRNLVAQHGADPARVEVTGQPAFDKRAVPPLAECAAYVAELLDLPAGAPYLLVATSLDAAKPATMGRVTTRKSHAAVEALAGVVERFPELHFVLKPHPSEAAEPYAEMLAGRPNCRIAPPTASIDRLLRASRGLLAASATTTVLDALCLEVPVLAVDVTGGTDPIPYASLAVPTVSDLGALEPALRAFIGDPAVRAAQAPVSAALARTNARSAEKIAALIERIARR